MNRFFTYTLLYLIILLCSLSHALSTQAAINETGSDFIFFYSNDVQGETEPCG